MWYDTKCPCCGYRFGRLWFFRLIPHRAHACPNCGAKLKDKPARASLWSAVIAMPAVLIYILWRNGYFPHWTLVLIPIVPLAVGCALFPYISKFRVIEDSRHLTNR